MEPATREKILTLLQHSPNLTAAEISRALRVTRHDIRYHLKALLAQGSITQMPAPPRYGGTPVGRPASVYQLTAAARPDLTDRLADILLEMGSNSPSPSAFLDDLSSRLVPGEPLEPVQTHLPQRLNASIQIINQHPYQARWEAHSAGPQVIFGNCPFSSIIEKHPELCQVDCKIIENLTGLRAVQIRKIDLSSPSSAVCIFRLSQVALEGQPLQNTT